MARKTFFLGLILGAITMAGCAAEVGDPLGSHSDALGSPPRVCPAIAILCAPGYQPKSLPNCNQICVPTQGLECETDLDCGPIYCVTTPCEQPICRGHQCVVPNYPDPPAGGEPCGDTVCGANSYCCNASCGICAPLDGACIQIACIDEEPTAL